MNIVIRRAKPEDIDSIYDVIELAFEDYRKIGCRESAIQFAIIQV